MTATLADAAVETLAPTAQTAQPDKRRRTAGQVLSGVVGGAVGLAPHVLHHVGLLAGTALVAGSGGTAVFAAVGLAATIPLLVRLRRRFCTWAAPAVALGVFTVTFALSAFVLGPAVSGQPAPTPTAPAVDHGGHHSS